MKLMYLASSGNAENKVKAVQEEIFAKDLWSKLW